MPRTAPRARSSIASIASIASKARLPTAVRRALSVASTSVPPLRSCTGFRCTTDRSCGGAARNGAQDAPKEQPENDRPHVTGLHRDPRPLEKARPAARRPDVRPAAPARARERQHIVDETGIGSELGKRREIRRKLRHGHRQGGALAAVLQVPPHELPIEGLESAVDVVAQPLVRPVAGRAARPFEDRRGETVRPVGGRPLPRQGHQRSDLITWRAARQMRLGRSPLVGRQGPLEEPFKP